MMMPWKVFFQPSWATRAKLLMIVIWLGTMERREDHHEEEP